MQPITPRGVLAGLSASDLHHLVTLGTILQYNAGDIVIREHSVGREWYIVLEGLVRIDMDPAILGVLAPGSTDPRQIVTLGAGGGFGELALFDAGPRSARVVALEHATQLLVITPEAFDALLATGHTVALTVLNNIVQDLATKLRNSRLLLLQQLEAAHHVRALYEELAADCALVDPFIPLQKTLVIRDRDAFVLHELAAACEALLSREILDILVFADAHDLHALLDHTAPSGEAIFHGLFSLLRHGRLPAHSAHDQLSYRFEPECGRRAGTLRVNGDEIGPSLQIDWEVKGWSLDWTTATARASLCLSIASSSAATPGAPATARVADATMPIQEAVTAELKRAGTTGAGYRVLAVHHRTHEVAQTLQALSHLGFALEAFVGIPYGEASWATSLMLDEASGHRYLCLQAIPHATGRTNYHFDSLRSSFLPDDQEREIAELYSDSANTGSYRAAMSALLAYLLDHALRACYERGERLLLYEDGAYLTPLVYAIYHTLGHPLHPLVRTAVDNGVLVGSVEVTSSGDRAQAAVIKEYGGRALLPVISGARDDVKLIFEAVGVAEAVIHAASTALGNLGLPTFGLRRIAVLGGNGAIGVRLVEQLAQNQRSVEQIFVVDRAATPFMRPVPVEGVPAITERLRYQPLPRHTVAQRSLPRILGVDEPVTAVQAVESIVAALEEGTWCDELVLRFRSAPPAPLVSAIWELLGQQGGYQVTVREPLPGGHKHHAVLQHGQVQRCVTLLGPETVIHTSTLAPLLHAGLIDTVIGVTGTAAFSDEDFEAFLERPTQPGGCDELVLISGSSKDYEFQRVLARLQAHAESGQCGRHGESGRGLDGFSLRKSIHPDVGSIYHLSRAGARKRLILLSDGFVVNFFARYEKGVKAEYMDPIMTMQLLGLVSLVESGDKLPSGVVQAQHVLPAEQMKMFWTALNARCTLPRLHCQASTADTIC